jgi:hypothetical protein
MKTRTFDFAAASIALGLALAGAFVAGCGASAPRTAALDPARLEPRLLYPMQDGYVWSYDVDTGTGVRTFAVSRVVEARGSTFSITNGGSEIVYEVRPEGIYRPQTSTWLLRAPIEVGASWPSTGELVARVTSVTEIVDIGAGHFEGCVEVVEDGGETGQRIRTVYCSGLGPALVESTQSMELSGQSLTVRGELIGLVRGAEDAEEPEAIEAPRGR